MFAPSDLIVAPATVPGAGLRGIVRLAGDGLAELLGRLIAVEAEGLPAVGAPPRLVQARLTGDLAAVWGPLPLELLWWPGPGGPIGGPLAELQLPASQPLQAAVVAAACAAGGRLARGGEFTLRAFLAGRLDLVQAEAVLAVVDARTPEELAHGLDRLAGGAGRGLAAARDALLDLVADVEAAIDFADETAPDAVPAAAVWTEVSDRIRTCDAVIAEVARGLAERDASAADLPRVVLAGPANIGKSSLFNALVVRDAALVADERGTTRDWLEARLGSDETACLLVDLPGDLAAAEAAANPLAAEASARARRELSRAAVVVNCRDAATGLVGPSELGMPPEAVVIDVVTRSDLAIHTEPAGLGVATSTADGRGVSELRDRILAAVAALPAAGSPATLRLALGCRSAREALASAAEAVAGAADEAMIATLLRQATAALAEVTGAAIGTDLLDRIFSRHCIGK
jgi:tRNA modification GTPase